MVHYWCAVWSEGVKRMENEELENVDKAVISGTQRVSALSVDLDQVASGKKKGINRLPSQNLTYYHWFVPALRILQKAGRNHSMPC